MVALSNLLPLAFFVTLALSTPSEIRQESATFVIDDLTYGSNYVYSTPAHLAVASGQVSFNLTNTAVPYTTSCSATGTQLWCFFCGTQNYTCAPVPGATGNTTFAFTNTVGYPITVNQTWSSDGKEYLGTASTDANLVCNTTTYQNPNWTMGEIYSSSSTTCKPVDLTLPATVTDDC